MRFLNEQSTINNASTTETAAVDASQVVAVSAQAVFSDNTAAGAFKLQGSNDPAGPGMPANWNDIPNTSQTVASGATTLIPKLDVCYRWIRAAFVSSGGAGTINVALKTIGF